MRTCPGHIPAGCTAVARICRDCQSLHDYRGGPALLPHIVSGYGIDRADVMCQDFVPRHAPTVAPAGRQVVAHSASAATACVPAGCKLGVGEIRRGAA